MNLTTNTFLEKRNDLETFVEEQILGPGAFNKRFFFLKKWDHNEFRGKLLDKCSARENISEVIAEVPAYQYSSAILFPIAITTEEREQNDFSDDENPNDEQDQSPELKADDEGFEDEKAESVSSKNQNYPNTCGLSFAIEREADFQNDISISMSYRSYERIKQQDLLGLKLGYWIQFNSKEISDLIIKYYSGIFEIAIRDGNCFVCVKDGIDLNEHLYSLDYDNLERLVKATLVPLIEQKFPDKQFYKRISKRYNDVDYEFTTIFEDSLNDEIVHLLKKDKGNYALLRDLIHCVELYSQLKELITEIKTIFRKPSRKNKPTPVWESCYHVHKIDIPKSDESKRVQRGEVPIDESRNLYLNYQYVRKENQPIYVKLILINKNEIQLKENEPPQLNKKDRANELSFFGIQMTISENKQGVLCQYNPPNLLEMDEEGNLNKLLYREYKDLGEGYNTSVAWGIKNKEEKLNSIYIDFLPSEETPNVDFKPSKLSNGRVYNLIDEEILSIRGLSTLTSRSDEEILFELDKFVGSYGSWIEEKLAELELEQVHDSTKKILQKQLRACEGDFARLKRNLSLLSSDEKALAAFRCMNTAMFMQLHHSIEVKRTRGNGVFVPNENNETYYRNLKLNNDYKWRSFQLAFIILNIDGFVRPKIGDQTVKDVFGTGWPERNELADLVWFPTGGGKTEAYLGIIAFTIAYRRFSKGTRGNGTTVLMRYTLRLLTLQQFQRATLLICALETIRKGKFQIPYNNGLGEERITIGLFVGGDSLPNKWDDMNDELLSIAEQLNGKENSSKVKTKLPHTECPWCGGSLFINKRLSNVEPRPGDKYGIDSQLKIMCNTPQCTFYGRYPNVNNSLPIRLFDEDVYKYPPTLLFGTVDKFAALANKVSVKSGERNQDSRRLLGKGVKFSCDPPELIIQDELHLLLGPLGTAVGLFEKAIDELCTIIGTKGQMIRPKIITSTATTRNTDKQIFALFNRRSEIFPKQGIKCDDSFFAYYKRKTENPTEFDSNRKYIGVLPFGKTQVWMQLRLASIALVHRLKFIRERFEVEDVINPSEHFKPYETVLDYYHTLLSYFNSLKEVGKTQSQLTHYLPGDVKLILKNTVQWTFLSRLINSSTEITYSELTGRLSGEEVKTNLSDIEKKWNITTGSVPPEFIISTNMISVGIDVSRFNTMIINSMPRNTAEYIQASSRVARNREGLVFTVHHPFRSRDLSHYQRFKEFHEKFYSYVEPISVTPFADKALERYLAMFLSVIIRHENKWGLTNNDSAASIDEQKLAEIKRELMERFMNIYENAAKLNEFLKTREAGVRASIEGIFGQEEYISVKNKISELLEERWLRRLENQEHLGEFKYRDSLSSNSLFTPRKGKSINRNWNVKESLREIPPAIVIKTVQQ